MMLRLALYFAIVMCVASPGALGQGLDLGKVIGELNKKPWKCGQCSDAYSVLVGQVCQELFGNAIIPPFISPVLKAVCDTAMKAPLKFVQAERICQPFGLCQGKNYKDLPITCKQCPKATKQFVRRACSVFPQLPEPIPSLPTKNLLRGACYESSKLAFGQDMKGVCQEAGWCP